MYFSSIRLCIAACVVAFGCVHAVESPATAAPDKTKALESIKTYVGEAASSGKKIHVWVTAFGGSTKAELSKSDAKKLTVVIENNPFDLVWEKLSNKDVVSVGKACIQEDGKRALLLCDFLLSINEYDEAEKTLISALQLNKDLTAEAGERGKILQDLLQASKPAAAPPKPAPPAAVKPPPAVAQTTPPVKKTSDAIDVPVINDELSAAGKNPWYPKSAGEMKAMLKVLDPSRNGPADIQSAYIHRLMQHRYICNVPYEGLHADDKLVELAEHAALICNKLGKLTHNPEQPPGMDDAEFALCKKGAGSSNLFGGLTDPVRCVDGWMDDSDRSNIDRLGHRRWCINPKMMKTGFGRSGNYAAMHSFDSSRKNIPDWDFVGYPARGFMPVEFFGNRRAWSVSLNNSKYGAPTKETLKVELFHANDKFEPEGEAMKLDYMDMGGGGYGTGTAIIFRPESIDIGKGGRYVVKIDGFKSKGPLTYGVHFVKLKDMPDDDDSRNVLTKYFTQRVNTLAQMPQPIDQFEGLIQLSEDKLLESADPALAKTVAQGIANLAKDAALRREHESRERYKAAAELERKSIKQKSKKLEAVEAYGLLAQEFKDTNAGQKAAADWERLRKELQ